MDLKKHGEKTDNLSKRIYLNKVENEIMFKIKTGYYLELLALETMKLPWGTKSKITKDNNGENVPHFEITELVLIHYDILTTIISTIQESCIHLFLINNLVIIRYFTPKFYVLKNFWFRIFIHWSMVYWSKF